MAMDKIDTTSASIILFDGVCNLCTGSVQLVLKHDKIGQFQFASLQSAKGQLLLQNFGLSGTQFNSFVLIENGQLFTQSTAALKVARKLNGAWPLLYGFIILPPFIRDAVYKLIANNRYRWFGKKDACWLPRPEWKNRFLN